ncbi:Response regulator receiver modulated diguanylate cyclase/phosphodiesterase [Nitrospira sp. KM1]|uniref:putative bifunctional diguanylate cyclase/phosphodiesterase n=1 Tax=Nitrospira sp. KM1 TaxID=1936990 RepID=UPI0013A71612|nr:EAL domain-containing protein [Nitrospira sp. KM1]BCA55084.1 Response regulator receiver modulated diguanylate cyclase/phosphodiesterase [Nitrospira sp. KM1]
MSKRLNIILLEDSAADAELMLEALREAGFDPCCRRVDTRAEYVRELARAPEIILSDFSMPQFSGREALQVLQEQGLDIPFIIVSGCIGEEMAVECMKLGATDYLLKDRLGRLGYSVSQALERRRLAEEKRQTEQRLFLETFNDSLTGLPNRSLFLDRLDRVFRQTQRHLVHPFAVLYLGLDGIRVVQDSLGPSVADQLLIEVSQRLLRRVRTADTVARIEGSDFAFLLDNLKVGNNATRVAERLHQSLQTPMRVLDKDIFLTGHIGIALFQEGYASGEQVLRDAATAMHRAKACGSEKFVIFDKVMHEQAMERLRLEADLRQAIVREEFRLHYQPIVSLRSGVITGFESLIRWQHPVHGLWAPDRFLDMAAELGLVTQLGSWGIREAARQLAVWQRTFPDLRPLTISVNVTAQQFSQPDFLPLLHEVLSHSQIEVSSLKIEITESDMMQNSQLVAETLKQMESRNIESCLDDFGTGYSSLSHLQQLPIQFLKIDQSFVRRLGSDDDALAIVKAIVVLAHQLGRQVIAEGIETERQLTTLRSLGCEFGQGYWFAKPLSPEDAQTILSSNRQW